MKQAGSGTKKVDTGSTWISKAKDDRDNVIRRVRAHTHKERKEREREREYCIEKIFANAMDNVQDG